LNPVHIPTTCFFKINFIIIFHLRLGLSSGLFPSGLLTNILFAFIICPTRLMLLFLVNHNIWRRIQMMMLLSMHFSPFCCYYFSPKSKYSRQHFVLKHRWYMFCSWDRSISHAYRTGKVMVILISKFLEIRWGQKFPNWMVATSIRRI
jgi:hypothetical protein